MGHASSSLYLSVIHAMHLVTEKVPIADDLFWEIVLALRPFLDARVHPELAGAVSIPGSRRYVGNG
jgi:hypothetical protein